MCCGSSENFKENHRNPEKDEMWWEIWAFLERRTKQSTQANLRIDPPKLPRKSRAPPRTEERLGGNAAPVFDEDILSYYRKICYEDLDCITNAITDHFDQQNFKTYFKLENLLIKTAKRDDFHAEYDDILSIYRKEFDNNRFQVQYKIDFGVQNWFWWCQRQTQHLKDHLRSQNLLVINTETKHAHSFDDLKCV